MPRSRRSRFVFRASCTDDFPRALLRQSYTLIAPLYDLALARATAGARRTSIASLEPGKRVLLPGIGTGLDLPHAPSLHVESEQPAALGGWFRLIRLRKQ